MFSVVKENTYSVYRIKSVYALDESNLDEGFWYLGIGNLSIHKLVVRTDLTQSILQTSILRGGLRVSNEKCIQSGMLFESIHQYSFKK